jgi:hypothetical protein
MRIFVCTLGLVLVALIRAQSFHPDIPKVWDDREMARFELPLAHAEASLGYMPYLNIVFIAPGYVRSV